MKALLKSTVVMTAVLMTVTATAAQASQNKHLTDCKSMINAEFNDVKRIKLAGLKERRGNFTAKFRVSADGQRASYTCTVEKDAEPQIARTDRPTQQVAGGE